MGAVVPFKRQRRHSPAALLRAWLNVSLGVLSLSLAYGLLLYLLAWLY